MGLGLTVLAGDSVLVGVTRADIVAVAVVLTKVGVGLGWALGVTLGEALGSQVNAARLLADPRCSNASSSALSRARPKIEMSSTYPVKDVLVEGPALPTCSGVEAREGVTNSAAEGLTLVQALGSKKVNAMTLFSRRMPYVSSKVVSANTMKVHMLNTSLGSV